MISEVFILFAKQLISESFGKKDAVGDFRRPHLFFRIFSPLLIGEGLGVRSQFAYHN